MNDKLLKSMILENSDAILDYLLSYYDVGYFINRAHNYEVNETGNTQAFYEKLAKMAELYAGYYEQEKERGTL